MNRKSDDNPMGGMKIFKDYGSHISGIKWVTCIIWSKGDTTRAILNITAKMKTKLQRKMHRVFISRI